ncbi:hypothetical protein RLEG12_19695 [Rhizobium leguminosarum bv. trifolii CB782]|uniref:DUF982 domain-containing protein n=1 Tax=Rhizobium hidalgonense TaxID=1538159 RepID=A0A2A6KI82_9HYPH|nr:DUF982 domain-containing protein [Rhizobium hidalgonense]AHG45313.1 hypothetical protein RLEG12_19695 [Rhizobium leguminosarum bv. trifolii CB782]EJC72735.1 Protein of unknown function (DUF982) [Rhizobium leguminosarum bv. trifolii WSM2012]MDR9774631.1 DUF982 domain-containing protein [Rhizobium hidalgonense]MDR9805372.1 DUF982 domain-containing protein [Rhizobium hidalgonense]MDR9809382.1 DUF982 domain-containing protein [Rhizobium hidalgonense]
MSETRFDPVLLHRQHFIAEITCLDEIIDFLDEWPEDKRGLAYDTLLKACRDTASGRFPLSAARENFRRFLKMSGVLAKVEGAPKFEQLMGDRNIGNA